MITNKNNNYKGFTLVEIMVSLVISSILMLGVIQVFSNSKRNSKVNEAVSRVQENARFAMESMITVFRKAGYVGCNPDKIESFVDTSGSGGSDLFDLSSGTGGWEYTAENTKPTDTTLASPYTIPAPFTVTKAASSWENASGSALPASLVNEVAPGSDVIVVKWAEPVNGVTGADSNKTQTAKTMRTTASHGIEQGQIVLISNCKGGDLFTNVDNSSTQLTRGVANGFDPGNVAGAGEWSQKWQGDTQIMSMQSKAFYVGEGAGGGPALWQATYGAGDGTTTTVILEELVEGIENIQVLYGVDTDDDGIIDGYNTAEKVNHTQVVGLKLGMIVASDIESLSTAKSRVLNVIGTYVKTPNDRRLRYVFSSTTKLRNKGVK